jgi:hypothetical protein
MEDWRRGATVAITDVNERGTTRERERERRNLMEQSPEGEC